MWGEGLAGAPNNPLGVRTQWPAPHLHILTAHEGRMGVGAPKGRRSAKASEAPCNPARMDIRGGRWSRPARPPLPPSVGNLRFTECRTPKPEPTRRRRWTRTPNCRKVKMVFLESARRGVQNSHHVPLIFSENFFPTFFGLPKKFIF